MLFVGIWSSVHSNKWDGEVVQTSAWGDGTIFLAMRGSRAYNGRTCSCVPVSTLVFNWKVYSRLKGDTSFWITRLWELNRLEVLALTGLRFSRLRFGMQLTGVLEAHYNSDTLEVSLVLHIERVRVPVETTFSPLGMSDIFKFARDFNLKITWHPLRTVMQRTLLARNIRYERQITSEPCISPK